MNKVLLNCRVVKKGALKDNGVIDLLVIPLEEGRKDNPNFIRVKFFKNVAKTVSSRIEVGSRIGIEGAVASYRYDQDGKTVYGQYIYGSRIEFLEKKTKASSKDQIKEAAEKADIQVENAEF